MPKYAINILLAMPVDLLADVDMEVAKQKVAHRAQRVGLTPEEEAEGVRLAGVGSRGSLRRANQYLAECFARHKAEMAAPPSRTSVIVALIKTGLEHHQS